MLFTSSLFSHTICYFVFSHWLNFIFHLFLLSLALVSTFGPSFSHLIGIIWAFIFSASCWESESVLHCGTLMAMQSDVKKWKISFVSTLLYFCAWKKKIVLSAYIHLICVGICIRMKLKIGGRRKKKIQIQKRNDAQTFRVMKILFWFIQTIKWFVC